MIIAIAMLSGSCATVKSLGTNAQRIANGQSIDKAGMQHAVAVDTKNIETSLQQLRRSFEKALVKLRTNVQQRWGQKETKVASRTVYVKYTQGYKSRVVTDFDHGFLIVETLDDKDPQGSLKTAIVTALLTSSDPASVDLFSDKDVNLESNKTPYLFGLVLDNAGAPIRTRKQAEQFASFLVPQKIQTRMVQVDNGSKTAWFVKLTMVKNYEEKGVEHYRESVAKYATQYQVSPSLILAIMRTESNFNPFAVSGAPAYGLMQLVPTSGGRAGYQRAKGVSQTPTPDYLYDPEHNIELGTAYLSVLSYNEFQVISNQSSRDYCVIAAYNTGPRNVTSVFSKDKSEALNNINSLEPPTLYDRLRTSLPYEETRQYVVKVTNNRKQFVGTVAEPAVLKP